MKPQNETYIKTKCPNLIQTYMCDFQEALENQKRKKKPEIDLNVEDSEELDKSPLTPMPIKCKKEKGKNVMNPDDYFKELICKALKIDVKNLHEPYFKKFLTQRKHNVAKIMESKERKELKFCKDLLKMKHKEVALKAGIEKDKGELKMSVQTDVAFRIYRKAYGEEDDAKINENNALTRKGKTPKLKRVSFSPTIQVTSTVPTSPIRALPKRLRPSTSTSSNFLRLSAINTPVKVDPLKVEQENKRLLASVAEDIQRKIMLFEKIEQKGIARKFDVNLGTVPGIEEEEQTIKLPEQYMALSKTAGNLRKQLEEKALVQNKIKADRQKAAPK